MRKKILTAAMCFCAVLGNAQTKLTATEMTNRVATSSNSYQSIHDPSVVYDSAGKKFWIVGSHIGVSSSTDLVNWSGMNTGSEHSTFFNKSYATAFSACPEHEVQVKRGGTIVTDTLPSFDAGTYCAIHSSNGTKSWISGNMWAPDIIYNPHMGKWCLYLSLNGDHWASVIILMTASQPQGPYKYEAPIVFGGFNGVSYNGKKVSITDTDMRIVTGSKSTPSRFTTAGGGWGDYYPNCIDPCVFFAEDGELWMSYGSWSGGIWMLKLDKNTGLRDYTTTYTGTSANKNATSDQYYGKKIAGGYYVSGEGSYIQHIGDYYYLFMTYGGLGPSEGYEMRVFRSASPTGPYKDAAGNAATFTSYQLNYGPNAATNKGMKVIGAMNNWGTMTTGECAQGHNSAVLDADGNAYVVFHTKFNNGTVGHQFRVHRLFVNEKGWLVTAPFRYTGTQNLRTKEASTTQKDIETKQLFTPEEIAGTYRLLVHPYRLDHKNMAESVPVEVQLQTDGTVKGSYTGTWKYSNDSTSFVTVKLGNTLYYGVVEKQMINGNYLDAICITAISTQGEQVWMYKYDEKSALAVNYQTIVTNYLAKASISTPANTGAPAATDGVKATYTSADEAVFSSQGVYTPAVSTNKYTKVSLLGVKFEKGDYYVEYQKIAYFANNTKGIDINDGKVAHYVLNALDNHNELNDAQEMTVGRGNTSGKEPVIYADEERGDVLWQYFGAQAAASYAVMPNPLQGTGADAFTVSFWVKPIKRTNWDCLFAFFPGDKPTASGGRFFFTDNTYCGFNDDNGAYFDVNYADKTINNLTNLKWSFVTLTMSKSGYKLYVNGAAKGQSTYKGSSAVADFDYAAAISQICEYKNMCLGMGSFWGSSNALLSDLSVYTRALNADEVKMLYGCSLNPAYNMLTVGIDEIQNDEPVMDNSLYNLNGMRVSGNYKGIVIRNGKKFFVK